MTGIQTCGNNKSQRLSPNVVKNKSIESFKLIDLSIILVENLLDSSAGTLVRQLQLSLFSTSFVKDIDKSSSQD